MGGHRQDISSRLGGRRGGDSRARTRITGDVALWVPAGEAHQIINTGADVLKLATVFVPGYTADENYKRCLDAAQAANGEP
jgi:oxalate decarboxylase/phosphoglucose isomerase-like protein (cupin superfamily)